MRDARRSDRRRCSIYLLLAFLALASASAGAQTRGAGRDYGSDPRRAEGDHNRAAGGFDLVTAFSPSHALAYFKRGNARKEMGDLAGALSDYTRAIELDAGLPQVYNNRGNTLKAMGDYEAAIKDYDKAIEIHPRFAFAYNNRGAAWFLKGALDRAVSDYNKAIKLKPDYAMAYANRGLVFQMQGDSARAERDFIRCMNLQPESEALCKPLVRAVRHSKPMG